MGQAIGLRPLCARCDSKLHFHNMGRDGPISIFASPHGMKCEHKALPGWPGAAVDHHQPEEITKIGIAGLGFYEWRQSSEVAAEELSRRREEEMLFLIGLGLGDEKDITLRGLEAVKKCEKVYMEAYTSLLRFGLSDDGLSSLEKLYGKTITVADREMVEEKADQVLTEALSCDVAFLVVGDPFGATTHSDLLLRAKQLGVNVKVIHNASIMNAIGVCGLQLYHYGAAVSVPFFSDNWRPDSFYEKIQKNRELGLHTLCLLDIRVKEPSWESLARGRKIYEPPRFMTINTAIEQLLEVECTHGKSAYSEDTDCIGIARMGTEDQMVAAGTMRELLEVDFGPPLHCLVIVGKTHPLEEEMLNVYRLKRDPLDHKDDRRT